MGINLLPQVEETEKKQFAIKKTMYIIFGVWLAVVIPFTAGLFLYKGIQKRRLAEAIAQKREYLSKLKSIQSQVDTFYNIAYKTYVLDYVGQKKYKPSIVADYIDKQVANRGVVSKYFIDRQGTIKVDISAYNYSTAVKIWHSLLENENIIMELNLNSFAQDDRGRVRFVLKGRLNLPELYKQFEKNGSKQ